MSNRLYNFLNQLISGSVAKSSEVNAQFQALDTASSLAELELNRAIKFPSSESATNQVITPTPVARQGAMLGFDLTGNLTVTKSFLIDWDMASHRILNLPNAVSVGEPVTLGQLNAYSTSLVAGMPSITGQNGPLTTNGSTVVWDSAARLVPLVAGVAPSSALVYSSGSVKWLTPRHNIVIDPNGTQGSVYWATTLNNVEDHTGFYWRNTGVLTTATFDHKPQTLGYSPVGGSLPVTFAATMSTGGTSAGTIQIVLKYYEAGLALISTSTATPVTMASAADTRYQASFTTPPSCVWVAVWVQFAGVSASAIGVKLRDVKLENGADSTPFNDDKTLSLFGASKASNPFGFGFATPSSNLGDATATASSYTFRSAAGAQSYDARITSSGGTSGTAGKGALAIESKSMTNTGVIGYAAELDKGNAGAAITYTPAVDGAKVKITMNAATPVITIAAAPVVGQYQIKLVQDPATLRVPSFSGFVAGDCVGNVLPTISQVLSGITFIYLYWDGTQYWVSSNVWD